MTSLPHQLTGYTCTGFKVSSSAGLFCDIHKASISCHEQYPYFLLCIMRDHLPPYLSQFIWQRRAPHQANQEVNSYNTCCYWYTNCYTHGQYFTHSHLRQQHCLNMLGLLLTRNHRCPGAQCPESWMQTPVQIRNQRRCRRFCGLWSWPSAREL